MLLKSKIKCKEKKKKKKKKGILKKDTNKVV